MMLRQERSRNPTEYFGVRELAPALVLPAGWRPGFWTFGRLFWSTPACRRFPCLRRAAGSWQWAYKEYFILRQHR